MKISKKFESSFSERGLRLEEMNDLDSIEIYTIVFTFIETILVTEAGDAPSRGLTERIMTSILAEETKKRKIEICRKEFAILNDHVAILDVSTEKYAALKPILETYRSSKLRKVKFTITKDYEEIFKVFEAVKTYIRKTEGPSSFAIMNLIENKLN